MTVLVSVHEVTSIPFHDHNMADREEQEPILGAQGGWHDGLCNCCSDPSTCCSRGCQWAQTMHRANVLSFGWGATLTVLTGIALFACYMIVVSVVGLQKEGGEHALPTGAVVGFGALVLVLFIAIAACGAWGRQKLRQQYAIDGTLTQDFCLSFWCAPCARCQEARHVDRATNQLGVTRV